MVQLRNLESYSDNQGNKIIYDGSPLEGNFSVLFRGKNNTLTIDSASRIRTLNLRFDSNNGECKIGKNVGVAPLQAIIRIGEDSKVIIGDNVSTTKAVQISAVEGTTVKLGDDMMIAGNVKVRGDDGHPIFDVGTGKRVNPARDITFGNHIWLGIDSTILGGTVIGEGSVVGTKALVKGKFPNNCIIAGVPAKVIRKDIAWERPHLSVVPPYYKPDSSTVKKTAYWNKTEELDDM